MAKDISSTQKLLVALISNLSNEKGYCYATNAYLGECLDVSPITISQNITDLENKGYIGRVMYLKNNIEQRFLTVNEKPIAPPLKTNTPLLENNDTPPIENHNHNNKLFNNKIKNKLIVSDKLFQTFFDLYDKKTDTKKCKDLFEKLPEQTQQKILQVVPLYVSKTPDKKFRKHPLTWLRGNCWDDDYSDATQQIQKKKPEPKYFHNQEDYESALAEWNAKNPTSNLHDIQGHLL